MTTSMQAETPSATRAPLPLILIAFAGAAAALLGGWWDDAWHTARGRDEFFIAPHIAIYSGIAVAGAALVLWALVVVRRADVPALWGHKPLVLALVSVAVTLASGPIDNFWHLAFGRDAVIWSAPHMLGIAGTLALAASLLGELAGRRERWAAPLSLVGGALVLASASFAVAEYDTDVPQFDSLWYLPVLGFASAIALTLIRTASEVRYAASISAAIYTVFIAIVVLALSALGFPGPALPLLVAPALVVDFASWRRLPTLPAATLFALTLYLVYVPTRNWLGHGVEIDLGDVAAGLPLTVVVVWTVFRLGWLPAAQRDRRRFTAPGALGVVVSIIALPLTLAPGALAHDPGQGEPAGSADLTISLAGTRARVSAELDPEACSGARGRRLVARRAGITNVGSLSQRGCRLAGSVELPERGRWFVYVELARGGRAVETWLPISVGTGPDRIAERARYAYFATPSEQGPDQLIAALVLYAGMFALIYAALTLIRQARRDRNKSFRA